MKEFQIPLKPKSKTPSRFAELSQHPKCNVHSSLEENSFFKHSMSPTRFHKKDGEVFKSFVYEKKKKIDPTGAEKKECQ